MTICGHGVDIIEIARVKEAIERQGHAFIERCFLAAEQEYCGRHSDPAPCYAARFAAKEAVAKAMGTGFGAQLEWLDVEVRRKATGEPFIVLHGTGAETARRLGITGFFLSLSHSQASAIASVIAVGA